MNAVAAPDGGGVFMLHRAAIDRGQQRVDVGQQDVGGLRQLHAQRRVEHVRAGHALVHEACLGADLLGDPVEKRDNVVLGHGLDRVDGGHVDGRVRRPPIPERLGARSGHNAQFAELLCGVGLDLEPDLVAGFGFPDRGHRRAGVTGYHAILRMALYAAPLGRYAAKGKRERRFYPRDRWQKSRIWAVSDQSLGAQRDVSLAPNDDMVMHFNAQQSPGLGDALGHLDVGAAGFGRSRRMVVDKDQ